jgi:hypothetical protein
MIAPRSAGQFLDFFTIAKGFYTPRAQPTAYNETMNDLIDDLLQEPPPALRIVMGSTERSLAYVPEQLAARVLLGNLVLDLRGAQLAPETTLEVHVTMGNLEVMVPPGVEVDVKATAFLGNIEEHTERRAGGPIVRVIGRVKLGNLEVSAK